MNGIVIVLVAAVVLVAGYLLYGRWLARTWGIDAEALTPARRMEDGKNFSPASCFTAVLAPVQLHLRRGSGYGHHRGHDVRLAAGAAVGARGL